MQNQNNKDEQVCVDAVRFILQQNKEPLQIESIAVILHLADTYHEFWFNRTILFDVPNKKVAGYKDVQYIKELKKLLNKNKSVFKEVENKYSLVSYILAEYEGLSLSDMVCLIECMQIRPIRIKNYQEYYQVKCWKEN